MSTPLALPTIFRARALAANGVPWLEEGVHFRVNVNPWIGFPIHPFATWRMQHLGDEDGVEIVWRNRDGKNVPMPFDIQSAGGELFGTLKADPGNPWIWIELDVNDGGIRIDLLDGKYAAGSAPRILATRSREPFRFGDAEILHLRVTGSGKICGGRGLKADRVFVEELNLRKPDFTFGLPIKSRFWYAPDPNDNPRDAADRRVKFAAPRRLSPPDNPTGALPDDSCQGKETERIMSLVGPNLVDPWLSDGFNTEGRAPASIVRTELGQAPNGKQLTTNAPVTPSLLTMAVDPQIARYLGLATTIGFAETDPIDRANIWLIASRWAVQLDRAVLKFDDILNTSIPLSSFLNSATAVPNFINDSLDSAFPDAQSIIAGLPNVPDRDGSGPWTVVTLLAVAVASRDAPPDPPDPFALAADGPGSWNAQEDPDNPVPESWQQSISLGDQPARGMVGFARMSPGEPVGLHKFVPAPGEETSRALPIVPNWASNNKRLVTDRMIPPDPAGASWQVWQADEFGQWSNGATLSQPLAARPLPPAPVAEVTYAAFPDDHSVTARIPGSIHIRLDVPDPLRMSPGSLPIVTLDISVDGVAQGAIAVVPGDHIEQDFSPLPFGVGEHRAVAIVATFTDNAGNVSPAESLSCTAFDARAPQFIPTSPLVIWTGQSDATGQAELALTWPPQSGAARYRVYLGDERRLANAAGINLSTSAIRSSDADPIHAVSASFADKHLFTFLGETQPTPGGDGRIHFSTQLPGSLRGLQFVRVVPLTQGGAEAPFQTCGLVPVAIPGSDRPPAPIVETATDPAAGVTLTIRARGLRKELIEAGGGKPPEFRIRRTRKNAANRAYVPVRTSGVLTGPDADGVWSATIATLAADLDPFVRYNWFAETRYPAEPPIPPGVVPLLVDGGVEPVWTIVGADAESVWSDLSLAAETLLIPVDGPDAPVGPVLVRNADGTNTITVSNLPVASSDATGSYQLEIYRSKAGFPPELVSLPPLSGNADVTWTDATPATPNDDYDLVIVDPIGRRSEVARAL